MGEPLLIKLIKESNIPWTKGNHERILSDASLRIRLLIPDLATVLRPGI